MLEYHIYCWKYLVQKDFILFEARREDITRICGAYSETWFGVVSQTDLV